MRTCSPIKPDVDKSVILCKNIQSNSVKLRDKVYRFYFRNVV